MALPVLLLSFIVLRALGACGLSRVATWHACAAHALAIMLVMTSSAHFVPAGVTFMPNHDEMTAMVPPMLPFPSAVVYATGVLELAGAIGLLRPRTRTAAGLCLATLFVVMFPANIYAAAEGMQLAGKSVTPLWQRIPEQLLYIGFALWAARGSKPDVASTRRDRQISVR